MPSRRALFVLLAAVGLTASVLVLPPGASAAPLPPTLNPAVARDAGVDLTWSSSAGATSYKVYRGTAGGFVCPGTSAPVATVTTTSYTDVGLLNRATYYYRVVASDGTDSACSGEQSATPIVGPYNWDFNRAGQSFEGWGLAFQNTPTVTTAGKLSLSVTGTDPSIQTADGLGIDATKFTSFQIRMSNGGTATGARIFWTTDTDLVYDLNKSILFTITPSSGETTYTVTGLPPLYWQGRIKQIRFDPQDAPGGTVGSTVVVDWFKVVPTVAPVEPLTGAIYFTTEDQTDNVFHPAAFTDFDTHESFAGRYNGDSADRLKIMEQEIDYAANAGIDYFSFEWLGQTPGSLDYLQRIQDFQAAANNDRMKFTVMPYGGFSGFFVGAEAYPADKDRWEAVGGEADALVALFLDPDYLKIGNRPVLHWWNLQTMAGQPDGFGDCIADPVPDPDPGCWFTEIEFLRAKTIAAGLGTPYIVDSSYGNVDMARTAAYGFDASSSYGGDTGASSGQHHSYTTITNTVKSEAVKYSTAGVRLHPPIIGLRDKRARNCQDADIADFMIDMPTYRQWEDNYRDVYEGLQQYPGRSSDPGALLMYAWNEQEESGAGLLPTLHEGTSFLDAIQAVQSGVYPATYYEWINDSMRSPASNGKGFDFVGTWTWTSAVNPICPSGPPFSHSNDMWGFYGNDERTSSTTNDTATLVAADTTALRLVAATGPDRGKVNVQIDGGTATSVDLYSSTLRRQQQVYEITGLAQGSHTIKLTVTGTKNASSSGFKVGVDAVRARTVRPTLAAPTPSVERPQRLVASREHNRVDLTWDRVPGAVSYEVFRGTTNNFTPGTVLATVNQPTNAESRVRHRDTGALNGTKYFYVVRVTGGGTAYSTQAQAIPAVAATFNRPASASSTSGPNVPGRAVDGSLTQFWRPLTANAGEYLQVNLAGPTTLNRFFLKENSLDTRVNNFKIQTSTDGVNFTDLYNGSKIGDYNGNSRSIGVKVQFNVTHLRLVFTSTATGGAPRIAEFQAYLR